MVTAPPPLVDSHCHLAFEAFDGDRPAVVERARQAGIAACVVVAVDSGSARQALELAQRWPGWAHPTAGIHPTERALHDEREWPAVLELLDSGSFHAVGETGLDAFHDRSSPGLGLALELQVRSLHRHLRAALDRSLPVILHCRDAFERLAAELAAYRGAPLTGVLHCYTGSAAELPPLLEAGLHIGVGGIATFKARDDLRAAVLQVPLTRLLLETDAPWLAPMPVRGRRNEPAFVAHVAASLARDRGIEPSALAAATTANADALFRLGIAGSGGRRRGPAAGPLSPPRPA